MNKGSFSSPLISSKDRQGLVKQIRELAPYYTPEWRFSEHNPDVGSTLALTVAEMMNENIKRLNKVPFKNYIAFLNLLNSRLQAAKPATAYVTFEAVKGVKHPVHIPKGTQLAATREEEKVIFETLSSLVITPARVSHCIQVCPSSDQIVQGMAGESGGLDQNKNMQEHALFIAQDDMFNVREATWFTITLENRDAKYTEASMYKSLADTGITEWLYPTAEGWIPFTEILYDNDRLLLKKNTKDRIVRYPINGQDRFWIVCRKKKLSDTDESHGRISRLSLKAEYVDIDNQGGSLAEQIFQDDVELDQEGFFPFGKTFAPYSVFYIGSTEVLNKRGSRISITFDLSFLSQRLYPNVEPYVEWKLLMKKSTFHKKEYPPISIASVIWEYWNGKAWVKLQTNAGSERVFQNPEGQQVTIQFICPDDMYSSFVNAHENYWIRARVLDVEHLYSPDPVYQTPWIENLRLSYTYSSPVLPQACLTLNNLSYTDETAALLSSTGSFKPFHKLDVNYPSLYIGLDQAPLKGPISMLISIAPKSKEQQVKGYINWQYLANESGRTVWKVLHVVDETEHFTRKGILQFFGANDFREQSLFGKKGYWIRASHVKHSHQHANHQWAVTPFIQELMLNVTKAVQQERIVWEIPSKVSGSEEYQLEHGNVLEEEVWVEETNSISKDEVDELFNRTSEQIEVLYDSEGNIQKVWVKWCPTEHILESLPTDRHYVIHPHSGKLRFGDGRHGRELPIASEEQLKVSYKTVKGRLGNVAAQQITELLKPIPFIQGVINHEAASGGSDTERMEQAVRRAPQRIRHGDRAVTAEDFEQLVKENFPSITQVKCLSNYNADLVKEPGSLTLVVLQQGGKMDRTSFPVYKKQIEQLLLQKTANVIAFPQQIKVIEPVYVEVSVYLSLVIHPDEDQIMIEEQVERRIRSFLHPVTGYLQQQGWEIGQSIHPSVFYSLLSSIRGVEYIERCTLTLVGEKNGERVEIDEQQAAKLLNGIICNGVHSIQIRVKE
ncbi:putative baseplate assembly protein [Bacillus horti]|nr:putative baseplate assembly protein [Bacillus horti]